MRILIAFGLLLLIGSVAIASPSVTLTTDKTRLNMGDIVTYSSVISVPTGDTMASGINWSMTIDTHLTVTEVKGPLVISNTANIAWTDSGGIGRSLDSAPPVKVAISGAILTNRPDGAGKLIIAVGDMKAGESETITVKAQRTS